jgi:predicted membrane metal-binding protein
LLYRPGFVYSVAFQLSFAATMAVLLCVTRLPRRRRRSQFIRILSGVATSLAVSLCVQIFLLPIQLHYFDGVSLVTPLSTLLFLPAVAAVMLLTGLTLAVDCLVSAPADSVYGLLRLLVTWFEFLLFRAADLAPPLLKWKTPDMLVYYCGQAILWVPLGRLRLCRYWPAAGTLKIIAGTAVCACAFLCF